MTRPRIAIILGTTRAGRFSERAAAWIHDLASKRDDLKVELVDLRDHPMPFFDEPASNAHVPSKDPEALRWQRRVSEFDGYIFVTAEYNRTIPAVLKNALDYAYPEWNRKPGAYVGYGSVGAARAIEHLRTINVELQMAPTRSAVHIQGADFMAARREGRELASFPHLQAGAERMLDELAWWATALKRAREEDAAAASRAA